MLYLVLKPYHVIEDNHDAEVMFFMRGSRGGHGVRTPLKNQKAIGFHSNTGRDPLKSHKATTNVGPASAGQRNWLADHALLLMVLGFL